VNAGAGFDVLREEFGEDDLLGEEFGTDSDVGLRRAAAGEENCERHDQEKGGAHGWQCLMSL
jgi:hypothetical protein